MAKPIGQDTDNFLFESGDGSPKAIKKSELSEPTRNRLETFLSKSNEPAQDQPLIFNPQPEDEPEAMPAEVEAPAPQVNTETAPQPVEKAPEPVVPPNSEIENIKNGYGMREAATQKLANSQAAQANAETKILEDKAVQQDAIENKRIAAENERNADAENKLKEYETAVNAFANSPESKVDPGRLWAKKSAWEKITSTLGVILGGMAGGPDASKNSGLAKLNGDIASDIAEQKRVIDSTAEKLKYKATGVKNLYGMMRDHFGDERQAEMATKLAMITQVENKLNTTASKYKSPQIMANAQNAMGQIQIEKNKLMNEFKVNAQKNLAAQEVAKMKAQAALNKSNGTDGKLSTPFGNAQTADDAKKIKEAAEVKASFDEKLQELINLRKNKGAEVFNRNDVARGKQLSKQLLLQYKNLAKLGVLSSSDEDIINAVIPEDPLEANIGTYFDWAGAEDNTLTRLEKLKGDVSKDFESTLKTRLRDPSSAGVSAGKVYSPEEEKAVVWLKSNPNHPKAAAVKAKLGL